MWDRVCTQAANVWIFRSFQQRYVRIDYLSPITFVLFHLHMNLLNRSSADGADVKNHCNHCKELGISCYIV